MLLFPVYLLIAYYYMTRMFILCVSRFVIKHTKSDINVHVTIRTKGLIKYPLVYFFLHLTDFSQGFFQVKLGNSTRLTFTGHYYSMYNHFRTSACNDEII